jgi:ABC-type transport system substrate-binding protein
MKFEPVNKNGSDFVNLFYMKESKMKLTKRFFFGLFAVLLTANMVFAAGGQQQAATSSSSGKVTLRIADNGAVSTFDTFTASTGMSNAILFPLWADSLMATDHSGNNTPWLAESITPSADYLTYTIKLKQGVKFHSGNPLTSADIKATFERLEHPTPEMITAFTWSDFISDPPVETPDPYTAILHLDKLMVTFDNLIASMPIIDSKAYQANPAGYFRKPSGTGPFKVVSMDPTTSTAVFERNDDWWAWTSANKTNVDEIIFQSIPEDTTRISSLRAGELDISANVPMDTIPVLKGEGFNVDEFITQEIVQLGFKVEAGGIFADKNLREAFSLSLDRELLASSILGGGKAVVWPTVDDSPAYKKGATGFPHNIARAKQLVAASAYRSQPITLVVSSGSQLRNAEIAQAIQSMAAEAGFNIKVEILENAAYGERRNTGNYDILFTSTVGTNGSYNVNLIEFCGRDLFHTGFHNDELSRITDEWQKMPDLAKRSALAIQGFDIVLNNYAPYIYLYWNPGAVAMNKNVSNVKSYSDFAIDIRFARKTQSTR